MSGVPVIDECRIRFFCCLFGIETVRPAGFSSQKVADNFSMMRQHPEHPFGNLPAPKKYSETQAQFDDC
jgi:hypothetical protein